MVFRRVVVIGASLACLGFVVLISASAPKEHSPRGTAETPQHMGAQHSSSTPTMNALTGEDLGAATTSFGISMFSELASTERNVFVSPISVASALGMVTVGTTLDHKTQIELEKVLGFQVGRPQEAAAFGTVLRELMTADPKVKVAIANSVWTNAAILPEFHETVAAAYDAAAMKLPSTPDPINQWVSDKTGGLIKKLIGQIDPLTVAVLVNAVYFKGIWATQFDPDQTTQGTFHGPDGKTPAKFMHMKTKAFRYGQAEGPQFGAAGGVQLLELPYGNADRFSSVVVLPSTRGEGAMDALVGALTPAAWAEWNGLFLKGAMVDVRLPRFKMEYGVKSLKESLKALGVVEPFQAYDGFRRMSADVRALERRVQGVGCRAYRKGKPSASEG